MNDNLIALFRERWAEVSGEIVDVPDKSLVNAVRDFLGNHGFSKLVIASNCPDEIDSDKLGDFHVLADFRLAELEHQEAIQKCAEANVGLTAVDGLIAETGSLAMISRNRGDRLCSSLPPVHLCLVNNVKVYRDIEMFLKQIDTEATCSFITGPSRTADIEKVLVLGAHGPKRVVCFFFGETVND